MEERKKRRTQSAGFRETTKVRRKKRPLGLGEISQEKFPFVAVVNGETMLVDRMGHRVYFTPWL